MNESPETTQRSQPVERLTRFLRRPPTTAGELPAPPAE
jgi:hypothetical protein